jgi:hypothetical protein
VSSDFIDAKSGVRTPVEEARVVMPSIQRSRNRWAVMLAGGDGIRLFLMIVCYGKSPSCGHFCLPQLNLVCRAPEDFAQLFDVKESITW